MRRVWAVPKPAPAARQAAPSGSQATCMARRRPLAGALPARAPPRPPALPTDPARPCGARAPALQARFAVVRVNALAQKAEYIWYDGQEGQPVKVRQGASAGARGGEGRCCCKAVGAPPVDARRCCPAA